MAIKPRKYKKRLKPVQKLWEMDEAAVKAVVDNLKDRYPDSAQLARYEKELKRRETNAPLEDVE